MNEIVLITKTRTQNQGNQALSIIWRDLLAQVGGGRAVRPLERSPAFLKRYTLRALAAAGDPIAAFEAIAARLAAAAPQLAHLPACDPIIRHSTALKTPRRFRRLRAMLRLRSRIAAAGVGARAYRQRLGVIRRAALLVSNPAGEFSRAASDTQLAYLLELRIAQRLGVATAFVNVSLEGEDALVWRLLVHVLDRTDLVAVRDETSAAALRAAGSRADVLVVPDGVVAVAPPAASPAHGGIGLAINALQARAAGLEAHWTGLLDRLAAGDRRIELLSNEWSTDAPFWTPLAAARGLGIGDDGLDYRGYVDRLAGFDALVSSRLHTCILGMVAGVPIVPVETGAFKLSGFFAQVGLPDLPIRTDAPGWEDRILDRLAAIAKDRPAVAARIRAARDAAADRFRTGLTPRLAALLARPSAR